MPERAVLERKMFKAEKNSFTPANNNRTTWFSDQKIEFTVTIVTCVADKLNPGVVRLRISDQKLVPPPACHRGFL